MYIIFLLGLPASGKGELSQNLYNKYKIKSFSIGQALRDSNDPQIQESILKGNLLDNDMIINIAHQIIQKQQNQKMIIIDGFPRTTKQTKFILNEYPNNSIFIHLRCDITTIKNRILYRILCKNCKAVYNNFYNKITQCSYCNSTEFTKRPDDNEFTVNKRLLNQEPEHKKILSMLNKFHEIDSSKDAEFSLQQTMNILKQYSKDI